MPLPDPSVVALFCPATLGDAGASGLQVAIAPDGRRAVLAYSSLDALLAGCGEQAGWVRLSALGLRRLVADRDDVDTVWLDPARPVAGPATGTAAARTDPDSREDQRHRAAPAQVVGPEPQVGQDGPPPGGLA